MNPSSEKCSTLRRLVVEHLGIAPIAIPAGFLVMTCLAALAVSSSCMPKPTPPSNIRTPTVTPTPTASPTPTITPTPKPPLVPAVTLEEPEDGACLGCESPVTLRWSCPYALQEGECYQLRVKGQSLSHDSLFHPAEDRFTLPALSPGKYNWAVTVVRSTDADDYIKVSEESEWRSFRMLPSPVVHSIFPTSTVQGTSGVIVTVSGENFTHSLALTIGVPLPATFVSSSTITATIPMTLGVGEHGVIVRDANNEGVSFASFIVNERLTPTLMPTTALTPAPTIAPRPPSIYPPPELIRVEIIRCDLFFYWSWTGELAEDEYFALRMGIDFPGESKSWTKDTQYAWSLRQAGEYAWEVAICRGDPSTHVCEQLAVSDQGFFTFIGCGGGPTNPNDIRPDHGP